MSASQGLILALYALFVGVLLLAGFVYKTVRDRRERRKNPTLPFEPMDKKEHDHDKTLAAMH